MSKQDIPNYRDSFTCEACKHCALRIGAPGLGTAPSWYCCELYDCAIARYKVCDSFEEEE